MERTVSYKIMQIELPSHEEDLTAKAHRAFETLPIGTDYIDIEQWNYKLVYLDVIRTNKENVGEILEYLFEKFNIDHPEGYKGRSLSVSDIVILDDNAYYCNTCGWVNIITSFNSGDEKTFYENFKTGTKITVEYYGKTKDAVFSKWERKADRPCGAIMWAYVDGNMIAILDNTITKINGKKFEAVAQ